MKTIKIKTNDGKDFTLAFTRKTVSRMSQNGFKITDVRDNPIIGIPQLIAGAFLRFHPGIKQDEIDNLWRQTKGKEELLLKLIEMYQEPIDSLLEEPKEDSEKNATWEVCE